MTEAKGIAAVLGLLALITAVAWYSLKQYDDGRAQGRAEVTAEWDQDKLEIAKATADQIAKITKERDDAVANNDGVANDLQAQITNLRSLNSALYQRLRLATRPAAGSGPVPKASDNTDAATAAANDRLGQIDDALAATLTECAVTRSNYKALIAEITPQL
jgi:hypothetical protein